MNMELINTCLEKRLMNIELINTSSEKGLS